MPLEQSRAEGTAVEVVVHDGGEGQYFAQDADGLSDEQREELRAACAGAHPAEPVDLDEALRQVEW